MILKALQYIEETKARGAYPLGGDVVHAPRHAVGEHGEVARGERAAAAEPVGAGAALAQVRQQLAAHHVLHYQQVRLWSRGSAVKLFITYENIYSLTKIKQKQKKVMWQ